MPDVGLSLLGGLENAKGDPLAVSRDASGNPIAYGLYQITPDTAKTYGYDPAKLLDPSYNRQVATSIVGDLAKRYPSDQTAQLIAYNAGPGAADRFIKSGRNYGTLPMETQRYLGRAALAPDTGGAPGASDDVLKTLGISLGQHAQTGEDLKSAAGDREAAAQTSYSQADKDAVAAGTKMPHDVELKPWTQKQPEMNPVAAFGSVGSVFATLASALTHQPMVNALNAAAGAVNAYRSGDLEQYQSAYQSWKDNTQLALDRHKVEQDQYQDALGMMDKDMNLANAKLTASSVKFNDATLRYQLETGDIGNAVKILDARQQSADRLQQLSLRLQQQHDERMAQLQVQKDRLQSSQNKTDQTSLQKVKAATDNYDSAVDQIDGLIGRVRSSRGDKLGVTGVGGMVNRGLETGKNLLGMSSDTPASDFQSAVATLQLELPKLLTGTSRSAKDERLRIETILRGVSPGDTADKTINALNQVKTLLQSRRAAISSGKEAVDQSGTTGTPGTPPSGAPSGAKQAPDGNWYVPDPDHPNKWLQWVPE